MVLFLSACQKDPFCSECLYTFEYAKVEHAGDFFSSSSSLSMDNSNLEQSTST